MTATITASLAGKAVWKASGLGISLVRQPDAGQRHAGEARAEFLHRLPARDRLGEALCQFIEFIVHAFPFWSVWVFCLLSAGEDLAKALSLAPPSAKAPARTQIHATVYTHITVSEADTADAGTGRAVRIGRAVPGRPGFVRQPETGQRHACEADAEFLERRAAGDGLGQTFGKFIELFVHTFPLVCLVCELLDYGTALLAKMLVMLSWSTAPKVEINPPPIDVSPT
jgi:hypothetical protein